MLVALPIMLHFLHTIVAPQGLLADAIASFTALGDLVHLMCLGKSGATDEHAFAAAIERHARAFLEAYPAVESKAEKPLYSACAVAAKTRRRCAGRFRRRAQASDHQVARHKHQEHNDLRAKRAFTCVGAPIFGHGGTKFLV